MVYLFFAIIAVMRVIQKICSKKASLIINDGATFFHYGAYYQAVSALFGLVLLCIVGFYGFGATTVLCALVNAALLAISLYAGIEAVKGCTLMVTQIVAAGALVVPCIFGIFIFGEPMSLWQWLGLAVFMVSVILLASDSKKTYKVFTLKTFIMLVISFLTEGLVMVVQKYFAIKAPNGNVAMFSVFTFGFNALIMFIGMVALSLKKKVNDAGENVNRIKLLPKPLLLYGGLLALAIFAINQLVTEMAKTVPSAVLFTVSNAISIIITCVVGAAVFKERITVKNMIGIALGFASVVIISIL